MKTVEKKLNTAQRSPKTSLKIMKFLNLKFKLELKMAYRTGGERKKNGEEWEEGKDMKVT